MDKLQQHSLGKLKIVSSWRKITNWICNAKYYEVYIVSMSLLMLMYGKEIHKIDLLAHNKIISLHICVLDKG